MFTQSTSRDLKILIAKRHGLYFVMYMGFIAMIGFLFFNDVVKVPYKDRDGYAHKALWYYNLYTVLESVGLWMALIRLSEPFVFHEFQKKFCTKCKKHKS